MDLYVENDGVTPDLHTARLTLRALRDTDCAAVVAALNDWSVTRWLTMVPYPYAARDFHWFRTRFIPKSCPRTWALDAGSGLIGVISHGAELGYWLAPDCHGRGLMTEAAGRVVDWHFDQSGADMLSGYHSGNAASCNVLTKLGFKPTHVDRGVETTRGGRVDIQRMALSHADWRASRG